MDKQSPDKKIKDPDTVVNQVVGSLNIEGMKVPEDEKEILKKIASGELDADQVADEIVRKALQDNPADD
ncbi:MAG: antitoxin VbhA family protein [Endozoicomonas sp.]|uniref:antitoxin VbhA family protein n=1 Tax=Endozoicomonas sp. TaxID=1892382 RepID=UPI003D9AEB32